MSVDELSLKEFHVLSVLISGEASGRDLHQSVDAEIGRISGPGFYKMMARLDSSGYVESRAGILRCRGFHYSGNAHTPTSRIRILPRHAPWSSTKTYLFGFVGFNWTCNACRP